MWYNRNIGKVINLYLIKNNMEHEHIELVFKAISHLAWSVIVEGIFLIILGALVFFYPALLIILASIFFILVGGTIMLIGIKVKKYSKIKLDF